MAPGPRRREVVVHDVSQLGGSDACDVPQHGLAGRNRIVQLEDRELMPARSIHPSQLALLHETDQRLLRMKTHERAALSVALFGRDVVKNPQGRAIALVHYCWDTGRVAKVLLPTAA